MNQEKILQVSEDVSWVGVLDHDIITFDIVMETKYGTTYNAYFINADRKAVIETVKEKYWPEFKAKLLALGDPAEIEYIVCNHTEPDHSGSVRHLLDIAPDATVVGSGQALTYLGEMMDRPFKSLRVRDGDIIDLGNKKLRIIGAPNLHWPDTIYSYLEEDGLLFTCDSFGAHFADERIFDDLIGDYSDAFDYYFDVILKPFSKFMIKAIEKIKPLPLEMICPGHGPILRSGWKEKIERSLKLANDYMDEINRKNRILVAYVSAYGYTEEMAKHVAKGLRKSGDISVELVDIENVLLGDLEEQVVKADGILIGSPTINQNTLLPVYKLFSVINPIRDKGKPAAAFGSFGWSGEAVKLIEDHMRNLKLKVVGEGNSARFFPSSKEADRLIQFGEDFAQALVQKS